MILIDGRQLAEKIKDQIVRDAVKAGLLDCGRQRPNLAIILVGEQAESVLYVGMKEAAAKKVGIDTHIYKCPANIKEADVIAIIDLLNRDDAIDAILVQLPLPPGFDTDKIIRSMSPAKDVDRFHPDNLRRLADSCAHQDVMPPLFQAVLHILQSINFNLTGRTAAVIANSDTFGASLARVLACHGAKAVWIKASDHKLTAVASQADVVVTAVGQPHYLKASMIKPGAVIIDIGITKEGKKVYGDVDAESVQPKAGYLTPVPGGVGPMTVAMLFKNTFALYRNRLGAKEEK